MLRPNTPAFFQSSQIKPNTKAKHLVFQLLKPAVAAELKAMNVIVDYQHLYEMLEKYNKPLLKKDEIFKVVYPDDLSIEEVLCLSAEKAAYNMAKAHYEERTGCSDKMMPATRYVFFSPRSDLWMEVLEEKNVATLDKNLMYVTAALGGNLSFFEMTHLPNSGGMEEELLNSVLCAAAASGNVELMHFCIHKLKADPKKARMDDFNLVAIAFAFNHFEAVRYAFHKLKLPAEYKAGTNLTPYQVNVLILAASAGSVPGMKMAVAELRIAANSEDINGNNALNMALQAGEEEAVDFALNNLKLSLKNSCNRFGQHPLIHAIMSGKLSLVEKIAKIANLSPTNLVKLDDLETHPGFYAVVAGDAQLMEWVHQYYPLSAELTDGRNNLFLQASWCGNLAAARYCIDVLHINPHARDNEGFNALHHAARSNNVTLLRYLVEELQIDCHQLTHKGYKPLDFANNKKTFCYFRLLGVELTRLVTDQHMMMSVPISVLVAMSVADIHKEFPDLVDVRPPAQSHRASQ